MECPTAMSPDLNPPDTNGPVPGLHLLPYQRASLTMMFTQPKGTRLHIITVGREAGRYAQAGAKLTHKWIGSEWVALG